MKKFLNYYHSLQVLVWSSTCYLLISCTVAPKSVEQSIVAPQKNATSTTRNFKSACEYGKPDGCAKDEYCINVAKDLTECRSNQNVKLMNLHFPFEPMNIINCDQGPLSPPGNSHTWANTAFAIDLQSDRSLFEVPILSGGKGRVIAFNDCNTENDQCGLGFGNAVKILTDDGYLLFYAHLKHTLVKTGDHVEVGQRIGIEGTTGWTGKENRHLHLSVHYDWRTESFEYWKQTGYLPASVPFTMSMCATGCAADCNTTEVDVRSIQCKRTSSHSIGLCAR